MDPRCGWLVLPNDDDTFEISVHAKRTYRLMEDGTCVRREREAPLLTRPIVDPEGEEVFFESDVMPGKVGTDLVVLGTTYGRGRATVDAAISLGSMRWGFRVHGQRRCIYHGPGSLRFSAPEAFESISLSYACAFGGEDPTAERRDPENLFDVIDHQPGLYPRNPIGMGYAVSENGARLDGLVLPLVEHPKAPVTPSNLIAGSPADWWRCPLPWAPGWIPKSAFPRSLFFGSIPEYAPPNEARMHEVDYGWLRKGEFASRVRDEFPSPDPRLMNGAPPSMVVPTFAPQQSLELRELTAAGRLVVQWPQDRPSIRVRHRGSTLDLDLVVDRALVSTVEMGVSLVWRGVARGRCRRPVDARMSNEEPATYFDVQVLVDGDEAPCLAA